MYKKVEAIPTALQERYFEHKDKGYCWRREPHRSISFRLHNLIQDPPLPQIDLLVCRNLLMYLTEETQLQALAGFYSSLQNNGFLLLGNVETLVTRQIEELQPEDSAAWQEIDAALEDLQVIYEQMQMSLEAAAVVEEELFQQKQHSQNLFQFSPIAYLLTDADGLILEANISSRYVAE